jgi:hypothetical protein
VKEDRLCLAYSSHLDGEGWAKALEAAAAFRRLIPEELDAWTRE